MTPYQPSTEAERYAWQDRRNAERLYEYEYRRGMALLLPVTEPADETED